MTIIAGESEGKSGDSELSKNMAKLQSESPLFPPLF
jgi:hypothetical protein